MRGFFNRETDERNEKKESGDEAGSWVSGAPLIDADVR